MRKQGESEKDREGVGETGKDSVSKERERASGAAMESLKNKENN